MSGPLVRSYVHRGGETPLSGSTIGAAFADVVARHPDRDALVAIPQGIRLTYAELAARVDALARGLLAIGVARGDRVGIWATNNAQWVVLQLATARIGAVLVNVNPANRVPELRHVLERAQVQHLFLIPAFRSSRYVEMVCEVCPEARELDVEDFRAAAVRELRTLVVYDPADVEATRRPAPAFTTWPEVIARGETVGAAALEAAASGLDPDDPINIQFTSGTTGFPKAVVLSHHNILNNGFFIGEQLRLTERDRVCVPVPFYHCFGMVVANLACFSHGAAVVVPAEHFDAGETLAAIAGERCTAVHGVPTMFVAMLEHPSFRELDLTSLRTGVMAGAPCPPELVTKVMRDLGCREILIGYGQTEASPVTHLTHPDDAFDKRVETVGFNLPHQETKVVDTGSGATVPVGVQGEVCFRGYHVMRGYYGQPDATAATVDEAGWLHSGDLGVMGDDGYLRITGRLKDMIIRGGENIYPAEIENVYYEHPDVVEIAVFGVPDATLGETAGAWIQLRDGSTADGPALRAWARDRLAHFKIPEHVWLVDEFPMTVTGKIQKFRIKEIVAAQRGDG